MSLSVSGVLHDVESLAQRFASQRRQRSGARELSTDDFAAVAETGFHQLLVPEEMGGLWSSTALSTRAVAEAISSLAAGDSSLALILSMEPVAMFVTGWLADFREEEADATWLRQRQKFLGLLGAGTGAWGVMLSERDGVIRSTAKQDSNGEWSISGVKSSGSGWDHVSFMLTNAIPEGEDRPELFVLDLQNRTKLPGVTVNRVWDGHGMTASGSHAVVLDNALVHRVAWPGRQDLINRMSSSPTIGSRLAPFVGIVRAAVAEATEHVQARGGTRSSLASVEWARAQASGWLVEQAFEGVLHTTEIGASSEDFVRMAHMAKLAVGEQAEHTLQHISGALGGLTYSQSSPFGWWHTDVRAMAFIRPTLAETVDHLGGRLVS
ncbi:acyl-CoA/acyl-ACP dehydrogenase [Streptomyces canus]|uniref:acyl-CoA dehydrogenase family protein n=1 Tax=Streptomyces canus TaxID=58343 RepID=UPI002E28949D|nr:acyl-CoA dehydrogenase family protein [Streptomyces canus]